MGLAGSLLSTPAAVANSGNGEEVTTPVTLEIPSESDHSRSMRALLLPALAAAPEPRQLVHASHCGHGFYSAREVTTPNVTMASSSTNESHNVSFTQQIQNYLVNVTNHDPTITGLVEQVAEVRHREEMQELVSCLQNHHAAELRRVEEHAQQMGQNFEEQTLSDMKNHMNAEQQFMKENLTEYQGFLDCNLRQSIESKDRQIDLLRSEALEACREKDSQIYSLTKMLQNQSKMMEDQRKQTEMLQQQMQSFMANIGSVSLHGPDTVAACATTVKTGTLPTSKPIVHPPGLGSPSMVPTELATPRSLPTPPAVLRRDDRWAEESAFQTNFRPTNDESRRAPGGGGDPPNGPNGPDKPPDGHKDAPWEGKPNPRPKVRDGGGGDGPSDDDGDGGDDGGDSGDDGNDSDRKFLRRMKALMGYGGSSKKDDNRVKEADSVKLPGWPQPETYRNWRIKVRDAVVAASAKPDEAFKWISETHSRPVATVCL